MILSDHFVMYTAMGGYFKWLHMIMLCFQTAESVAESVLSLASMEACVRVTVDRAEEELQQQQHQQAPVVVHSSEQPSSPRPSEPTPSAAAPTATDLSNLTNQALSASGGAEGLPRDPRKAAAAAQAMVAAQAAAAVHQAAAAAAAAAAGGGSKPASTTTAGEDRPANLMSVSVPNLTSSVERMEQTVSLLESFAAVARRNLGNSTNNMSRSNNTNSLVRLAMQPNSPGRWFALY